LLADRSLRFPPVLLARGLRDDWFTGPKFDADVAALTARNVSMRSVQYDGAHEWNTEVAIEAGRFLEQLP
jgi:predicted esterase